MAWDRLEVDPSPGGALDWDAGVADALAELPGLGVGQELPSDADPPAAAPARPAGVRALAPTFAELAPLVNPTPNSSASRRGGEPVASASVREPGPAVLGRRRGLLDSGLPAGLEPASAVLGGAGLASGAARRVLQEVAEGSGSAQGAPPLQATLIATFGAARLLVRRAQAPDSADPEDLDALLGPLAQKRAPLLQRLLPRWRGLGSGSGQDPELAAARKGPAGSSTAQGSANTESALKKRVMAAQRPMQPPAWITLATTSLAVAPGSNATLQLTFSSAL